MKRITYLVRAVCGKAVKLLCGFGRAFRKNILTKAFAVRLLVMLVLITVLTGVGAFTVSGAMKASQKADITAAPTGKYDCIVVLGCLVYSDGTPCDRLADRINYGIEQYRAGVAPVMLMSGDGENPDEYDEVTAMKRYAIAHGVPEENILTDPYGLSTYDSIWRIKNVYKYDSAVIVTQQYHLSRALYIAEKLGVDACGVPADPRKYQKQLYHSAREVLARFKDFFFVQLSHEPEYTE